MNFRYLLFTLLFTTLCSGQVFLEHSYSNPNSVSADDIFFTFNSESGLNYYTFNKLTNIFNVYNESHSLIKTFTAPIPQDYNTYDIVVTDKLFDSDNNFEFLISLENWNVGRKIILVKDNGDLIQEFNNKFFAKFTKSPNGSYKLIVKNIAADVIDVYTLPGFLSNEQQNLLRPSVSAFPNPASNSINITNRFTNKSDKTLEIYDISGKKILSKNIPDNDETIVLNISGLPSGIYIYKINGQSNKFIKE